MTVPKKASDTGAWGKWIWTGLAAARMVGAGEEEGVRGQVCVWISEARNWDRRYCKKSKLRVETFILGHARCEEESVWPPGNVDLVVLCLKGALCAETWSRGNSSAPNLFPAACSLSQCTSAAGSSSPWPSPVSASESSSFREAIAFFPFACFFNYHSCGFEKP